MSFRENGGAGPQIIPTTHAPFPLVARDLGLVLFGCFVFVGALFWADEYDRPEPPALTAEMAERLITAARENQAERLREAFEQGRRETLAHAGRVAQDCVADAGRRQP